MDGTPFATFESVHDSDSTDHAASRTNSFPVDIHFPSYGGSTGRQAGFAPMSAPSRGFYVIEERHRFGYGSDDPAGRTVLARPAAAAAPTWMQLAPGRAGLSAAGNPARRAAPGAPCHSA